MYMKYTRHKMKSQRRNQILLLSIIFLGISIFLLFLYISRTVPEFNQYRLVRTYPTGGNEKEKTRTILLWSAFFGDKRWSLPDDTLGPADFRDTLHCPIYKCELSNNHDYLPIEMYDAIVFHTAEPFPFIKSIPSKRSTKQLYVFALMESPGETKHILSDEKNFYNLTMTYRLDSDIIWPYKAFQDIETGAIVAPTRHPVWRQPPTTWNDSQVWELWSQKENDIAWFVSHCDTLSEREKLAASLQQHINIDIFGKCGPKSCQRSLAACDDMLDSKYKFYLSFENSLCTDYVTEKLYNALNRSIIPVVFGGANYLHFAPPQSYINAENFETVEELASYLKYLSSNPMAYMRYFWWRRYYRLTSPPNPFCDLCEKLHTINYHDKIQIYNNIEQWWIKDSCRFKPKIKY